MNEPASIRKTGDPTSHLDTAAGWVWPKGHWLGVFELQAMVACSAGGIVYRAWDHGLAVPVAIKEYLPVPLAARIADGRVAPLDIENAARFERGLRAFIEETRALAQFDHPALVRMLHLLQLHGTAYRVMPWYSGRSLIDVRRDMVGPPNEASLRGLLDDLLGALQAYHRVGQVHGGLHPAQIMLLSDNRALLLGSAATQRALVDDTAQAAIDDGFAPIEQTAPSPTARQGPGTDFYRLAQVARYWITGMMPPLLRPATVEPLAASVQRLFFDVPSVRYSDALLRTLDAALSPEVDERPQSVEHFREELDDASRPSIKGSGEADAPRHIQRAVGSLPPAPTATQRPLMARPEVAVPCAALDGGVEVTDERDAATIAPPRRRRHVRVVGWFVAALLVAVVAWQWREDLWALRIDSMSSQTPAVPAPQSAAAAPAAPDVTAEPAPVPEAPATRASRPETASLVNERSESPAEIPAPAPKRHPMARAESATPRALCGNRTQFALYRCMKQQCSQLQWVQHPQCVRLRATDRAD
jgi:hypothetical protein